MTLRRHLLFHYSITLALLLLIVGYWSHFEFVEQRDIILKGGAEAAAKEDPLYETMEIIVFGGLPSIALGILAGALMIKRALRPIEELTEALERTNAENLTLAVPRSHNGDELDRMMAVFNDMKKRIGGALTQSREFTLHASHELKTPLTVMHGTLEQMLGDPVTPDPHRDRIASMLEEVQRLSTIVGQLTFLAKADAGHLAVALEPVQFDELVREIAEDTAILAVPMAIHVTLSTCTGLKVAGDRMRLRQLLLNLAENAVKYNHTHGSINLSLLREGDAACFRIVNTGNPLPPERRERVFERFFRGDASHGTSIEGCGLGLSIAQSIAHSHKGEISMDETPEGLTCVSLWLPLA